MTRRLRRTLIAAVLLVIAATAVAMSGGLTTGPERAKAGAATPASQCLDARHMALVMNAIRRGDNNQRCLGQGSGGE
jgi:hypothetical protein